MKSCFSLNKGQLMLCRVIQGLHATAMPMPDEAHRRRSICTHVHTGCAKDSAVSNPLVITLTLAEHVALGAEKSACLCFPSTPKDTCVDNSNTHYHGSVSATGQALQNPGLGATHWEQISGSLMPDISIDSSFTLAEARKRGLLQHLPPYRSPCPEV